MTFIGQWNGFAELVFFLGREDDDALRGWGKKNNETKT
jgi:hypothetical protein